jgi:hypothetical protein
MVEWIISITGEETNNYIIFENSDWIKMTEKGKFYDFI